jgi:hypothetical protein
MSFGNDKNTFDEHYDLFCKNISPSLQKELGVQYLEQRVF